MNQAMKPVTLFVFSIGGKTCAVDNSQVTEFLAYVKPMPIVNAPKHPGYLVGVTRVRGMLIPVIDLRLCFGFPARYDSDTVMIVIKLSGKSFGLVVDFASDVLDIADVGLLRSYREDVPYGRLLSGFLPSWASAGRGEILIPNVETILLGQDMKDVLHHLYPPRFLVVDDFSAMRRIIRGMLKELGYTNVEEAEDGVIAFSMLKLNAPFDVVITDVNMPNMNGFELLSAIKADESLRHLPVLMVTAEARKEDIVLAARSGAAGYVIKPFTRATLWDKIQKALGKPVTWR